VTLSKDESWRPTFRDPGFEPPSPPPVALSSGRREDAGGARGWATKVAGAPYNPISTYNPFLTHKGYSV